MRKHILLILLLLLAWTVSPARAQDPDPRFGMVQTYEDLDAAADLGVGFTRIKLYWDVIQPTGPDDWQPANVPDPLLAADLEAGREVVGLIVRTPAWARDPDHPGNDPNQPNLKDVPDMAAWGEFVARLAEHYQGRIQRWIIWNEPDVWDAQHPGSTWNGSEADYAALLKTAYLSIKAVDPSMEVYMAGLTYWWDASYDREQYLARLLDVLVAEPDAATHNYYFDGVIYHLYYKPLQIYGVLGEIQALLDAHDLGDKPIWLNETNAPPSNDPIEPPLRGEPLFETSLLEQRAFMIQVHAVAFAAGVERVQVYKLYNSTEHPENIPPFGLLRGDKSRRPAYEAYKVVTTYLTDFEAATLYQRGDVTVVVFDQRDQTTTVLWNNAPTPRQVTLNALADAAMLVDAAGQTSPLVARNGVYSLELPPAECFASPWDCFIGGMPRLVIEPGGPDQRPPYTVRPTPTPVPPNAVEIMAQSPRRRFVFNGLVSAAIVLFVILWLHFRE